MSKRTCHRPWLAGAQAQEALAVIEDIAASLRVLPPGTDASLAGGRAGVAVFFAYLDEAQPGRGHRDRAAQLLDEAAEALATVPMGADLLGGFPGVAWALTHLAERWGEADCCEDIDEALLRCLRTRSDWRGAFDLVGGLVGLGVYALERLPRPAAAACLALVVERLGQIAEALPGGLAFRTPAEALLPALKRRFPDGYYDVGVAHGSGGVIALLGAACGANVSAGTAESARALLRGTAAWLWAQRLPEGGGAVSAAVSAAAVSAAAFPSFVTQGAPSEPARSAWCYGDPGLAVALLCGAQAAAEPELAARALWLGRRATARPPAATGVHDAGLCHGAAGLGWLYGRLYQSTDEALFLQAARDWVGRTLALRRPDLGLAGYGIATPGADAPPDGAGLLGGVAGIGLMLLAATTETEPQWDRALVPRLPDDPAPPRQRGRLESDPALVPRPPDDRGTPQSQAQHLAALPEDV